MQAFQVSLGGQVVSVVVNTGGALGLADAQFAQVAADADAAEAARIAAEVARDQAIAATVNKADKNGGNITAKATFRQNIGIRQTFVADGGDQNAFIAAMALGDTTYVQPGAYPLTGPFAVQSGDTLVFEPGARLTGSKLSPFLDDNAEVILHTGGFDEKTYYHGKKVSGPYTASVGAFQSFTGQFHWDTVSDTATITDKFAADPYMVGARFRAIYEAGFSGGRIPLTAGGDIRGTPLFESGVERTYQTFQAAFRVGANLGGTALAPKGSVYVIPEALYTTAEATYLYDIALKEMNHFSQAGGSAAVQRMLSFAPCHAWRASDLDAIVTFSGINANGVNHVGSDFLIAITDRNSADPTYSGTTLFGALNFNNPTTKRPILNGFDLRWFAASDSLVRGEFMKLKEGSLTLSGVLIDNTGLYFGAKVVGPQLPAVADATNSTDVVTQFNTWMSRARTHGLVAT